MSETMNLPRLPEAMTWHHGPWAGRMMSPDRERRLIHRTDKVSVGVKTWGEILDENNARLQFVKEALEHNADDGQALAFLEERHREFLEGVVIQDDVEESVEVSPEAEPAAG